MVAEMASDRARKAHEAGDAIRLFDETGWIELEAVPPAPVCAELARVFVPKSATGFLTLLWQYLATPVMPALGPFDYQLLGVSVLWSLVLEDGQTNGPRRRFEGANAKPPSSGRVPPYGSFSDTRHPWGSAARMNLIIPAEHATVSLWVRIEAPAGQIRYAAGRLYGYTQASTSEKTLQNAGRGT